jgi:NitT/TauT family transport system permease protein
VGLELASILMIFSGQVWNMAFAFYASLKSIPTDLKEAAAVMELTPSQRMELLELPYSAMNLTWNSVMSMAGGWFFLTVCEAFTLGEQRYRLPGLGSYMAVAIDAGNEKAMIGGIVGMVVVILLFDILLWRPALEWAHRFRLEDSEEQKLDEPLLRLIIRDSLVASWVKSFYFRRPRRSRKRERKDLQKWAKIFNFKNERLTLWQRNLLRAVLLFASAGLILYGGFHWVQALLSVPWNSWLLILGDTGWTLARVMVALVLGTLWALPVGIWIALSPRRLKFAQPLIQLAASFPAPMLYPLAIALFLSMNLSFGVSAMLLMLLGVQWYILFNVVAGALRIPVELRYGMRLMGSNPQQQWRYLFLPSVLPSLVTGWITAAGGAWNASIVSEIVEYKGRVLEARGLGADIKRAAAQGDFTHLAACLTVMVIVVVMFNRTVWARAYQIAQTRFRMDL